MPEDRDSKDTRYDKFDCGVLSDEELRTLEALFAKAEPAQPRNLKLYRKSPWAEWAELTGLSFWVGSCYREGRGRIDARGIYRRMLFCLAYRAAPAGF